MQALRTAASMVAVLVLGALFSGCVEEGEDPPGTVSSSSSTISTRSPAPSPAKVDLGGANLAVVGELVTDVEGRLELSLGISYGTCRPFLFIPGATLVDGDGGQRSGLLVFAGPRVVFESGRIEGLQTNRVVAGAATVVLDPFSQEEFRSSKSFPRDWDDAVMAWRYTDESAVTLRDLRLLEFEDGLFLDDTGVWDVPANVSIQGNQLLWARTSTVRATQATVHAEGFVLAAEKPNGTVTLSDGRTVESPSTVTGGSATFTLGHGRVTSTTPPQLHQVASSRGLAVAAAVTLDRTRVAVQVEEGHSRIVAFNYTESSGRGDAVLSRVNVTGPGADRVRVLADAAGWVVVSHAEPGPPPQATSQPTSTRPPSSSPSSSPSPSPSASNVDPFLASSCSPTGGAGAGIGCAIETLAVAIVNAFIGLALALACAFSFGLACGAFSSGGSGAGGGTSPFPYYRHWEENGCGGQARCCMPMASASSAGAGPDDGLRAFPSWIKAGASGVAMLEIDGEAEPGTYDAVVRFEGANYPAVDLDVEIRVV